MKAQLTLHLLQGPYCVVPVVAVDAHGRKEKKIKRKGKNYSELQQRSVLIWRLVSIKMYFLVKKPESGTLHLVQKSIF